MNLDTISNEEFKVLKNKLKDFIELELQETKLTSLFGFLNLTFFEMSYSLMKDDGQDFKSITQDMLLFNESFCGLTRAIVKELEEMEKSDQKAKDENS